MNGNDWASFASLGISGLWVERLLRQGIDVPTPIQEAAIPALLKGGDAVIRAQTGTGKTLAYLLPLLERLETELHRPQAMILAPTAELAMQIAKVASALTEGTNLRALPLIGGANLKRQLEKLKSHPQLIIGTPGRIVEILTLKKIKPQDIRYLVIDEADQTFALGGGGDEAETILGALSARSLTVFCSATMPEESRAAVTKWARNASWIEAEGPGSLPPSIEHIVVGTEKRKRIDTIRKLIAALQPVSAILFINRTDEVAEIQAKLNYHGIAIEAVYGDQPKQERTQVMRKFRDGKLKLLIATDVAARGIDAPEVTHVIHADPPQDAEQYLHRAGRTGRMGRRGMSILVLTPAQKYMVPKLGKRLGIPFAEKMLYEGKLQEKTVSDKPVQKPARLSRVAAASALANPVEEWKRVETSKKRKTDRKRDRKNKGAPRWLKEKREKDSESSGEMK